MPTRRSALAVIAPPLAVTAVPLLLLVGLTILQLFVNVPDARTARANTLTSFNIIRLTHDIEAAIQDAERGQRGFLLTGREAYLEPYETARRRLPELMVALQSATVGS